MQDRYPKLFVVGCPRSGTSWLTRMIQTHPDIIAVPGESHVYSLIYEPFTYLTKLGFKKRLKRYRDILRYYGFFPLFRGIETEDIWQGIINAYQIYQTNSKGKGCGIHNLVTEADLKEMIRKIRQHQDSELAKSKELIQCIFDSYFYKVKSKREEGQYVFLEKTPMHLRYVKIILKQFPEAKVIEIVRDGRDVCVSFAALAKKNPWARKIQGQDSVKMINYWNHCIELGNKFRANPDLAKRINLVYYEQLRSDPYYELTKIFDFSNLKHNPLILQNIIEKNDIKLLRHRGEGEYVYKGSIGEWRERLSPSEIQKCLEIGGKALVNLGYEL